MVSNDKASVTKELNDKHRKILEGLLRLPENRECADCKSRGPRWASVNLGIFVCIQCSGIHRSLGVHISKVRSATLDTWLPEQVAFIQSMGNAKANSYWEAELPPNYDRVGLENFIRAKYEEKRWIPSSSRSPSRLRDEKHFSADKQRTTSGYKDNRGHDHEWNKNVNHESSEDLGASRGDKSGDHFDRTNTIEQEQKHKSPPSEDHGRLQRALKSPAMPVIPAPKNSSQPVQSAYVASAKKVDAATDLFDLLRIEEPAEDVDGSSSQVDDDNSWAAFQSAEASELTVKNDVTRSSEDKNVIVSGLEDLFKPSAAIHDSLVKPQPQPQSHSPLQPQPQSHSPLQPLSHSPLQPQSQSPLQPQSHGQLPQAAKKDDIMSLFEKSTMSSPYALHQQQMAALFAQQQSLLMTAIASSGKQAPLIPTQQQQLPNSNATKPVNGLGLTIEQAQQNANFQFPGSMNSLGTQNGLRPSTQVGGFVQASLPHSQISVGASGMYNMPIPGFTTTYKFPDSSMIGPTTSVSGLANTSPLKPVSEASSSSGANYDFSSLVAGELSKR